MRRYPLGIWAGIVCSLALAASAAYWGPTRVDLGRNSTWGTIGQLRAEYREATHRLQLPQGQKWPELPYQATDEEGTPYAFGAGVGTEWAEWCWFDAWASVAASHSVSLAEREAAVEELPAFFETTAYSTTAEPQYFRKIISAAQRGDMSGIETYASTIPPQGGGR